MKSGFRIVVIIGALVLSLYVSIEFLYSGNIYRKEYNLQTLREIKIKNKMSTPNKYDRPLEAIRYDNFQRAFPGGKIPENWRSEGREHIIKNNMAKSSNQTLMSWTTLGPTNVGGRIRSIIIDKNNTNNVYAGSVSGGVWKSTNAGQNWFALKDRMENLAVCALEFEGNNTDIIYAGTGEGFFNYDYVRGEGIFKSTDKGATWTQLASTKTSQFLFVNKLKYDISTGRLYAATLSGLFYTTNGGTNWQSASGTPGGTVYCTDLEIANTIPSKIYATFGLFNQSSIYRSTDGGNSFSNNLAINNTGRIELAISPSNSNYIYASFMSLDSNNVANFIKSTDGGNNYANVKIPGPSLTYSTYTGPQAWYDNIIAVEPNNPNKVFAGGVDLFTSFNGGTSWSQTSNWYTGTPYTYIHADLHDIKFDPSNSSKIYIATDGGVYISQDGGTSFGKSNSGLNITQFYAGTTDPVSSKYYGGTQDNGTLRNSVGTNWTEILEGDGGIVQVDYNNPTTIYSEYVNLTLFKSTNEGATFALKMNGIPYQSGSYGTTDRVQFIAPYLMDPNNSNILIAGTYKVYKTTNAAETWTAISGDLTGDGSGSNGATISALAIAKGNSSLIYAGCSNGRLMKTTNNGTNWLSMYAGLPTLYLKDIAIKQTDPNVVYICFSGYSSGKKVYKSTDAGSNWTNISSNLPNLPVNTLLLNPDKNGEIFAGTDLGLFHSTDDGATWFSESNLPNVRVDDLSLRSSDKMLFVFTHGRGVFKSDITGSTPDENNNQINSYTLYQNYPNPFNPVTNIKFTVPKYSDVKLEIVDLNGKIIRELMNGKKERGEYSVQWNGLNQKGEQVSSGIYIYRIATENFRESKKMLLIK